MKKGIIAMLMAAVMMTGCADAKTEAGHMWEKPETEQEAGLIQGPEVSPESEPVQESEKVQEAGPDWESEGVQMAESVWESGPVQEVEISPESEAAPGHVCPADDSGTVTVLAFGEHEPDCFYGARYDVKCGDCGEYLDVIYREPLGHTGDEGTVTCQPDCTGEGSIRYTCVRCGAEWSEAYGLMQPHTWVEGSRKETDWVNGGTREVSYLYCSVCGKMEESE